MSCTVLIVDDHQLFSAALRVALCRNGLDAHAVAVPFTDELRRRAEELPAGLAVLDLDLGVDELGSPLHGADLVGGLRACGWTVLVVSGSADRAAIAAAIAAGAVGAVSKTCSFSVMLATLLSAAAGEAVMSDAERRGWTDLHRRSRTDELQRTRRLGRLSVREREVLELLAEGNRATAIAERFVVSMTTIRTHIRAILSRLEVTSQLEAVALLRRPLQPRWDGSAVARVG